MTKKNWVPLLKISQVCDAMELALEVCRAYPVGAKPPAITKAEEKIAGALRHLGDIVKFRPGDLVQFQSADGKWRNGVVVALMVCEPRYICGLGDARNEAGNKEGHLLACPRKYVRPRRAGKEQGR